MWERITDILYFNEAHPLLFTQGEFWLFLLVVMCIFSLIHSRIAMRNAFLFGMSIFFYYKTSGIFTLALLSAIVVSYFIGIAIEKANNKGWQKLWLTLGIVYSLSLLCYFKYAYFFADVFTQLSGNTFSIVEQILLPAGIPFYTFQCISYLLDIYRGRIHYVSSILDFGFYVSFFPQLVAGPIVRANEFIPQLHKKYFLSRRQFGIAMFWILNGLIKKIVLSDYIAVNFVDRVFDNPLLYSGFENLCALFGYSLQVYADFSGYTDIAIGVAMLMGFYLPQNFNSPYKAKNPGEFWKRWHISLSRWLQDYLYIPLGGNRNATIGSFCIIIVIAGIASFLSGSWWVALGVAVVALIVGLVAIFKPEKRRKITTNINSMDTMLLGGLWHGASWNFMIWGGLNGVGILGFKIWRHFKQWLRSLVSGLIFAAFFACNYFWPSPVLMIFTVWSGVLFFGALVRCLYSAIWPSRDIPWLNNSWNIFMTFVFISFTRLFFRSGSNLDPAIANETAWNTAKAMVNSIGGQWNTAAIPEILSNYWPVFTLFVVGMIIHWLPEHFKRWYRVNFALMPIWLIGIVVVATIFVLYQFVTADLQPFIYFQF